MLNIDEINVTGDREAASLWRLALGPAYMAPEILYVWADHLEDALELMSEWADENCPGLLCDPDYLDAARDLGHVGQDATEVPWDDLSDAAQEEIRTRAEADLYVIGHTTLENGSAIPLTEIYSWDEIARDSHDWTVALAAIEAENAA